jgi:hypothetical protein
LLNPAGKSFFPLNGKLKHCFPNENRNPVLRSVADDVDIGGSHSLRFN